MHFQNKLGHLLQVAIVNYYLSINKKLSEIQYTYQFFSCFYFYAAFAWLKCEAEEDEECHNVLREANIIGRKGAAFGVENRYVRLSVVNSRDDFDLLLQRLQDLVSKHRSIVDGVMSL